MVSCLLVHDQRLVSLPSGCICSMPVGVKMCFLAVSEIRGIALLTGALIMSASHNPGGPEEDWGIKFNYSSGEPAPERITDAIYGFTKNITELKIADLPKTDLSQLGTHTYGGFEVGIVHCVCA